MKNLLNLDDEPHSCCRVTALGKGLPDYLVLPVNARQGILSSLPDAKLSAGRVTWAVQRTILQEEDSSFDNIQAEHISWLTPS